jgi:putative tributyrin esterase
MPFRTIEISDPRFEHDGLVQLTVKTPNLRGRGDITLWLPAGESSGTLPLVVLLHGVYGSHWAWAQKGAAHHTARRLIETGRTRPMALAMPSDGLWGDGSGYLPHSQYQFDRWVLDDVPNAAAEAAAQRGYLLNTERVFLAGLSMGGYGALRLGATYPTRFRAVCGLSSITDLPQMGQFVEEDLATYAQPDPATPSVLAMLLRNRANLCPLRFDCGVDDPLIGPNRALHTALTAEGIAHTYAEYAGGHEWAYWEEHLADALLFFDGLRS